MVLQRNKKQIALVMVFTMLLGLFPMMAPGLGLNVASAHGQVIDFSGMEQVEPGNAVVVVDNIFRIEGTANTQINSVNMTVKEIRSYSGSGAGLVINYGQMQESAGVNILPGNRVVIPGVMLYNGLNEIEIETTDVFNSTSKSKIFVKYQDSPSLYDIKAEGQVAALAKKLEEDGTMTIIDRNQMVNPATNSTRITGYATNANSVRVEVVSADGSVNRTGNNAFTANVSVAQGYSFSSQIEVRPGVNWITIIANTNTHEIRTTRQVMYYNGNPTFVDTTVENSKIIEKPAIGFAPPPPPSALDLKTNLFLPKPEGYSATSSTAINVQLTLTTTTIGGLAITTTQAIEVVHDASNPNLGEDLGEYISFVTSPAAIDIRNGENEHGMKYRVSMQVSDQTNAWYPGITDLRTNNVGAAPGILEFTLVDVNIPRVKDVFIVNGVNQSIVGNLSGSAMYVNMINLPRVDPEDNPFIRQTPFYIAVEIENAGLYATTTGAISATDFRLSVNGNPTTNIDLDDIGYLTSDDASKFVFIRMPSLSQTGTQNLRLDFHPNAPGNDALSTVSNFSVTYVFSPYVDYTNVVDGQTYELSTDIDDIFVGTTLANFAGTIHNLSSPGAINYSGANRNASLFINEVRVELQQRGPTPNDFRITDLERGRVVDDELVRAGRNTLRFLYDDGVDRYERSIDFFVLSTNVPMIPAAEMDGSGNMRALPRSDWNPTIFPYIDSGNRNSSIRLDVRDFTVDAGGRSFVGVNVGSDYNVFGSFKLVQATGTVAAPVLPAGNNLLLSIDGEEKPSFDISEYPINFFPTFSDFLAGSNPGALHPAAPTQAMLDLQNDLGLKIYYIWDKHYYLFELEDREYATDGSPTAYTFRITNANNVVRDYSITVAPEYSPFRILHPFRDHEYIYVSRESDTDYNYKKSRYGIVNQNYVDVVVEAVGADRVLVNGQPAARDNFVLYSEDPSSNVISEVPYTDGVFKFPVTNLRAGLNRGNRITIQVESGTGNNPPPAVMEVFYAPTNIPGHNILVNFEKLNGRYFDNSLTLSIPRGTTLVRHDVMRTEDMKTDVFGNHDILIGIANPYDGIIDRRDHGDSYNGNYVKKGSDFNSKYADYRGYFAQFPIDFALASKVIYIDGGKAHDDRDRFRFEPITRGIMPFQETKTIPFVAKGYSNEMNPLPSYVDRTMPALGTPDDNTPDSTVIDNPDRRLRLSQRGEITLAYDPHITNNAAVEISMFYFDDHRRTWVNIGGTVNERANTVTAPFSRFGYYAVGKRKLTMNDVQQHPYARNEVNVIYTKGIMKAQSPGFEFGVFQRMSRGEVATAIVKALQLPLRYDRTDTHFFDVPPGDFYTGLMYDFEHIETAAHYGIVRGAGPNEFRPSNDLTREEFAVILARALDLRVQTNHLRAKQQLESLFVDANDVSTYAVAEVLAVAQAGYIKGKLVNPNDPASGFIIMPQQTLTRPDAAIVLSRVMRAQKLLPDFPSEFQ